MKLLSNDFYAISTRPKSSKVIQRERERERKRDWERKNERDVWLTVKITKIRNQGTFEQASCGKASNTFKNKKE